MIWGPLIAGYLFLAGMSAGAFAATAYIGRKFAKSGKVCFFGRAFALVALCVGLVMLMVDAEAGLANPTRFFLLFSNPASVMSIGVYIICVYMVVLIAALVLDVMKKRQPLALSIAAAVVSLCLAAYTGFLLGAAVPYPLWGNAALPVLFVVSGASTGLAATLFIGRIVDSAAVSRMGSLMKAGVAFPLAELVVLFAMLCIVSWTSADGLASVTMLLSGSYALLFWGGVVAVGLVAPLAIELFQLASKKHVAALSYVSNAGVVIGGFCLRYVIIMAAVMTICI